MKHLLAAVFLALCCHAHGADCLVVIDPGHGGSKDAGTQAQRSLSSSNNATSPGGLKEKDLTLELSLAVRAQIKALAAQHKKKLDCVLTRDSDENLDFIQRTQICSAAKPVPMAIVSIHFNASHGAALGSLAVIQQAGSNGNYRADYAFASGLIKATNAAVAKYVPGTRAREPISDAELHGGAGSNFFYQLAKNKSLTTVPKCFLEVEFIDRKDVEQGLLQNRKAAFPVIARAIAEYLYTRCE